MFSRVNTVNGVLDPTTAEKLADLLYEIGRDLMQKKQYELAVTWLERSYDVLSGQNLELLSPDVGDLRLSVMHDLGRTSCGIYIRF